MKIRTDVPADEPLRYKDLKRGDVFIFAETKHQDSNFRLRSDAGYLILGDNVYMSQGVYNPWDLLVVLFPDAVLTVGKGVTRREGR